MNTLTNAEVARKYDISRPTVTRWIELSKEGKNNLQLVLSNKKLCILDNPHNEAEIKRLLVEGKKYKRNIPLKKITANKDIYKIFTDEEIIELLNDLEFRREVNLKYSYKNGGAEYWDKRYLSGMSPIKKSILEMMDKLYIDVDSYLDSNKKINVIDVTPGNSHPVKEFIGGLMNKNLLNRYVAIDISQEMLNISEKNMKYWFPKASLAYYQRDIETSRFEKIFLENKSLSHNWSNLILFVGNTISNYEDRVQLLKNLRNGMVDNDLIVVTFTLDSESNRSLVNYAKSEDADSHHTWILNLLGIDIEDCEISLIYDASRNVKVKMVKLDKDYEIGFDLFGERKYLKLPSKTEICVWKHYLLEYEDFLSELKQAKLEVVSSRKDNDLSNALVVCKAKF